MKSKTGLVSISIVLVVGALFWSLYSRQSGKGIPSRLIFAMTQKAEAKHPDSFYYMEDFEISRFVHASLLHAVDDQGRHTGDALENWSLSGNVISFLPKSGLRFSDGSAVTDKHIQDALDRVKLRVNENRKAKCVDLITTNGKISVTLTSANCFETFMTGLTNDFSAVTPSDAKVFSPTVTSGLYFQALDSPEDEPNALLLTPNRYHLEVGAIEDFPELEIRHSQSKENILASIQTRELSFSKTFDPEVLHYARAQSYSVSFSLPAMTWFLSIDSESLSRVGRETAQQLLSDVAHRLSPEEWPELAENPLENATSSFFPKDFGCLASGYRDVTPPDEPHARWNDTTINLINHSSGESRKIADRALNQLRSAGFRVGVADQPAEEGVNLYFRRQFLGGDVQTLVSFSVEKLRAIPDPDERISAALGKALSLDEAEAATTVCEAFSDALYIPIAHRTVAFIAKYPALLALFSRTSGEVSATNLPKIIRDWGRE